MRKALRSTRAHGNNREETGNNFLSPTAVPCGVRRFLFPVCTYKQLWAVFGDLRWGGIMEAGNQPSHRTLFFELFHCGGSGGASEKNQLF